MSIQLTVISLDFDTSEKPRTTVHDKDFITVGRAPYNDVVLENNDVSENHATIRVDRVEGNGNGPVLYITDLGSDSGTKVENIPLTPQIEAAMTRNQRISIGNYLIKPTVLEESQDSSSDAIQLTDSSQSFSSSEGFTGSTSFEMPAPEPSDDVIITSFEDAAASGSSSLADLIGSDALGPSSDSDAGSQEDPTLHASEEPSEEPSASSADAAQSDPVLVSISGEDVTDLDFIAIEVFDLKGKVLHKGEPLSGVDIDAGELGKATTDSSGTFEFLEIPEGTDFAVKAERKDFELEIDQSVGTVSSDVNITITATELFLLSGVVLHKDAPLAGVAINAGALGSSVTSSDGTFEFKGVRDGSTYNVGVSKDKFSFADEDLSGTIDAQPVNLVFKATELFEIRGKVIHKGVPLEGVEIDGGPLGKTSTAADGSYSFADVPDGTEYTITASKGKFVFGTKSAVTGS